MSDNSTSRMLRRLEVEAGAPTFLASDFQTPEENIFESEYVEVDVERDDEAVAVVVHSISAEGNHNEHSLFDNKQFEPPVYREKATIDVFTAIKRQSGQGTNDPVNYRANIMLAVQRVQKKLINKIRRAIELQARQIRHTGQLTLIDQAGNTRFTIDYKPKSSHFPTAGNDWGGGSETPLADLSSLARQIRRDGKKRPDKLTFGRTAWVDFMADTDVQNEFDNRRKNVGEIRPRRESDAASYMGNIWIDNYDFELWVYDADYKDPQTGNLVPYVNDDYVLMQSSRARLDLAFGGIPQFPEAQQRAISYIPRRASFGERGIDLHTDAWFSEDGTKLTVQVSTRALCIPTEIDSFGALNTRA